MPQLSAGLRSLGPRAVLLAGAALAGPALAQESAQRLPDIVITAEPVPTPAEEVVSAISVITAKEIELRQYRTLPQALQTVPGLNVVQQGAAGALTSVFARGTESNHTLVLLDGMEINDPSSPEGAFDFSDILLTNVKHIEVVRGPQSTLYGSDAMGAVVNIITKTGEGPPSGDVSVEGGSDATFNQWARVGGSQGPVDYSLGLGRYDTDGESITPRYLRPPGAGDEDDGFESLHLTGRLGLKARDKLRFNFFGRYADREVELDTNPEDPNAQQEQEALFLRGEAVLLAFRDRMENRVAVSYTDYDRRLDDGPDVLSTDASDAHFDGKKLKLEWQGDIDVLPDHVLSLGLSTEEERADSTSSFSSGFASETDNEVDTRAAFANLHSQFGERLFTSLGVRLDDHDEFNHEVTWRAGASYHVIETGTHLKASYGRGFKAPTLEQLYGRSLILGTQIFSGNPNLKPETSRGYDAGFEQPLWGERLRFGATYFHLKIDDLIDFDQTFTTLVNIGEASNHGVESFISLTPISAVTLRADYTYLRTENENTGEDLLRRPTHKASVNADMRLTDAASLALGIIYVGKRKDIDPITFGRTTADDYMVVDIAGRYQLAGNVELFGRIDNLLDKRYEPATAFEAPGLQAFAGIRAMF